MAPHDTVLPPEHTDYRDPEISSIRVRQIRQRMAVLSDTFRASYLEWFGRLRAHALDDVDVPIILEAAAAELKVMEAQYRSGQIVEAALAYGREQIRGLLERVTRQAPLSAATKSLVRHLITDSLRSC